MLLEYYFDQGKLDGFYIAQDSSQLKSLMQHAENLTCVMEENMASALGMQSTNGIVAFSIVNAYLINNFS